MNQSEKGIIAARLAITFSIGAVLALTGCTTPVGNASDLPPTLSGTTIAEPSASSAAPEKATTAPVPRGRTNPVPAPSAGTINEVIPEASPGPVTEVGIHDTADLPNEIAVNIDKVEAMETKATTPGEIAGPAIAMYVSIHNGSAKEISIDSVIVNLTESTNILGQPTTSSPSQPFAGELAAGASAQGVYVFLLPTDNRRELTLSVEYAAGQASAHFVGDVS